MNISTEPISMEDQLRSLGILGEDSLTCKSQLASSAFQGIGIESNISHKKVGLRH